MGMARVPCYPRPRITRVGRIWRVTYADNYNWLWTREFSSWKDALDWAVK